MNGSLTIGQKVMFGRTNGEKTLGTVLAINGKSVKVRQDEARGGRPVGTEWRVAPSFIYPLEGANVAAPAPQPPAVTRAAGWNIGDRASFTSKTGREVTGTVTRVNTKTVTLERCDDGSRGYRVPPSMLRAPSASVGTASAAAAAPVALPVGTRVGATVEFKAFSWSARGEALVKGVVTAIRGDEVEVYGLDRTHSLRGGSFTVVGRRTDAEVVAEFASVHYHLEPECLTADGERSRSEVQKLTSQLHRALRALAIEGGRMVSADEAFQSPENCV